MKEDIIQYTERILRESCKHMVKLDSEEMLLDRIIEKKMPEWYIEISEKELLTRKSN